MGNSQIGLYRLDADDYPSSNNNTENTNQIIDLSTCDELIKKYAGCLPRPRQTYSESSFLMGVRGGGRSGGAGLNDLQGYNPCDPSSFYSTSTDFIGQPETTSVPVPEWATATGMKKTSVEESLYTALVEQIGSPNASHGNFDHANQGVPNGNLDQLEKETGAKPLASTANGENQTFSRKKLSDTTPMMTEFIGQPETTSEWAAGIKKTSVEESVYKALEQIGGVNASLGNFDIAKQGVPNQPEVVGRKEEEGAEQKTKPEMVYRKSSGSVAAAATAKKRSGANIKIEEATPIHTDEGEPTAAESNYDKETTLDSSPGKLLASRTSGGESTFSRKKLSVSSPIFTEFIGQPESTSVPATEWAGGMKKTSVEESAYKVQTEQIGGPNSSLGNFDHAKLGVPNENLDQLEKETGTKPIDSRSKKYPQDSTANHSKSNQPLVVGKKEREDAVATAETAKKKSGANIKIEEPKPIHAHPSEPSAAEKNPDRVAKEDGSPSKPLASIAAGEKQTFLRKKLSVTTLKMTEFVGQPETTPEWAAGIKKTSVEEPASLTEQIGGPNAYLGNFDHAKQMVPNKNLDQLEKETGTKPLASTAAGEKQTFSRKKLSVTTPMMTEFIGQPESTSGPPPEWAAGMKKTGVEESVYKTLTEQIGGPNASLGNFDDVKQGVTNQPEVVGRKEGPEGKGAELKTRPEMVYRKSSCIVATAATPPKKSGANNKIEELKPIETDEGEPAAAESNPNKVAKQDGSPSKPLLASTATGEKQTISRKKLSVTTPMMTEFIGQPETTPESASGIKKTSVEESVFKALEQIGGPNASHGNFDQAKQGAPNQPEVVGRKKGEGAQKTKPEMVYRKSNGAVATAAAAKNKSAANIKIKEPKQTQTDEDELTAAESNHDKETTVDSSPGKPLASRTTGKAPTFSRKKLSVSTPILNEFIGQPEPTSVPATGAVGMKKTSVDESAYKALTEQIGGPDASLGNYDHAKQGVPNENLNHLEKETDTEPIKSRTKVKNPQESTANNSKLNQPEVVRRKEEEGAEQTTKPGMVYGKSSGSVATAATAKKKSGANNKTEEPKPIQTDEGQPSAAESNRDKMAKEKGSPSKPLAGKKQPFSRKKLSVTTPMMTEFIGQPETTSVPAPEWDTGMKKTSVEESVYKAFVEQIGGPNASRGNMDLTKQGVSNENLDQLEKETGTKPIQSRSKVKNSQDTTGTYSKSGSENYVSEEPTKPTTTPRVSPYGNLYPTAIITKRGRLLTPSKLRETIPSVHSPHEKVYTFDQYGNLIRNNKVIVPGWQLQPPPSSLPKTKRATSTPNVTTSNKQEQEGQQGTPRTQSSNPAKRQLPLFTSPRPQSATVAARMAALIFSEGQEKSTPDSASAGSQYSKLKPNPSTSTPNISIAKLKKVGRQQKLQKVKVAPAQSPPSKTLLNIPLRKGLGESNAIGSKILPTPSTHQPKSILRKPRTVASAAAVTNGRGRSRSISFQPQIQEQGGASNENRQTHTGTADAGNAVKVSLPSPYSPGGSGAAKSTAARRTTSGNGNLQVGGRGRKVQSTPTKKRKKSPATTAPDWLHRLGWADERRPPPKQGKSIANLQQYRLLLTGESSTNSAFLNPSRVDTNENSESSSRSSLLHSPPPEAFYLLKAQFDSYLAAYAAALRATYEEELQHLRSRASITLNQLPHLRRYSSGSDVVQEQQQPMGHPLAPQPVRRCPAPIQCSFSEQASCQILPPCFPPQQLPCPAPLPPPCPPSPCMPCPPLQSNTSYKIYSLQQLSGTNNNNNNNNNTEDSLSKSLKSQKRASSCLNLSAPYSLTESKDKKEEQSLTELQTDLNQLERTGILALTDNEPTQQQGHIFVFTPIEPESEPTSAGVSQDNANGTNDEEQIDGCEGPTSENSCEEPTKQEPSFSEEEEYQTGIIDYLSNLISERLGISQCDFGPAELCIKNIPASTSVAEEGQIEPAPKDNSKNNDFSNANANDKLETGPINPESEITEIVDSSFPIRSNQHQTIETRSVGLDNINQINEEIKPENIDPEVTHDTNTSSSSSEDTSDSDSCSERESSEDEEAAAAQPYLKVTPAGRCVLKPTRVYKKMKRQKRREEKARQMSQLTGLTIAQIQQHQQQTRKKRSLLSPEFKAGIESEINDYLRAEGLENQVEETAADFRITFNHEVPPLISALKKYDSDSEGSSQQRGGGGGGGSKKRSRVRFAEKNQTKLYLVDSSSLTTTNSALDSTSPMAVQVELEAEFRDVMNSALAEDISSNSEYFNLYPPLGLGIPADPNSSTPTVDEVDSVTNLATLPNFQHQTTDRNDYTNYFYTSMYGNRNRRITPIRTSTMITATSILSSIPAAETAATSSNYGESPSMDVRDSYIDPLSTNGHELMGRGLLRAPGSSSYSSAHALPPFRRPSAFRIPPAAERQPGSSRITIPGLSSRSSVHTMTTAAQTTTSPVSQGSQGKGLPLIDLDSEFSDLD